MQRKKFNTFVSNLCFSYGGADGFRYANIPSLALSERAPHGFVRYVHPYPRSHRGANNVRLPNLAESRAKVHSAGGFNSETPPKKDKKQTPFWCI